MTVDAGNSMDRRETTRQLRELKQAQYSATYSAISIEVDSLRRVITDLRTSDFPGAQKEANRFRTEDANELVRQLASLPLLADYEVLKAGKELLGHRQQFFDEFEGELLLAMRLDLDIPDGE